MATITTTKTKTTTATAFATPTTAKVNMDPVQDASPRPTRKIAFADLNKLPFPRKCVSMLGSLHWPCLYFPNYTKMIDELEDFIEKKDKANDIFDDEDLNDFGLALLEEDEQALNCPVLHWIGTGNVTFNPSEEEVFSFAAGMVPMLQDVKKDPELFDAVKLAKRLYGKTRGTTGRKRKAKRLPASSPKIAALSAKQAACSAKKPPRPAATDPINILTNPSAATPEVPRTSTGRVATESVTPSAPKPMDVTPAASKPDENPAPPAAAKPPAGVPTTTPQATQVTSPPELTGKEVLVEASRHCAGVGPLILTPADESQCKGSGDRISPSEYAMYQGGPTVEEYAASLEDAKVAPKPTKKSPGDRIPPAEYAMYQGETTVQEFAEALVLDAKKSLALDAKKSGSKSAAEESEMKVDDTEASKTTPDTASASNKKPKSKRSSKPTIKKSNRTPTNRPKNRILKGTPPLKDSLKEKSQPTTNSSTRSRNTGGSAYKPNTTRELYKDERQIPTFADVRPLLIKLGFVFVNTNSMDDNQEYRLAGYDKNCRSLGENYFTSEEAFRAHLCAHGLGEDGKARLFGMPKKDKAKEMQLERWIRLSIVKALPSRMKQLSDTLVSWKSPIKALSLIGFFVKDGYSCPLVKENDGVWKSEDEGTRKDLQEANFFDKLSRFGFPSECFFGKLTAEERLHLELHYSFWPRDWISPKSLDISKEGRGGRRRGRETLDNAQPRTAAKKQKTRRSKSAKKDRNARGRSKEPASAPPERTARKNSRREGSAVPSQHEAATLVDETTTEAARDEAPAPGQTTLEAASKESPAAPEHEQPVADQRMVDVSPAVLEQDSAVALVPDKAATEESIDDSLAVPELDDPVLVPATNETALAESVEKPSDGVEQEKEKTGFSVPNKTAKVDSNEEHSAVSEQGKAVVPPPEQAGLEKSAAVERNSSAVTLPSQSPAVWDKHALADCNSPRDNREKPAEQTMQRQRRNISEEIQRSDDDAKMKSCLDILRDRSVADDLKNGIVFGDPDSHFRKNAVKLLGLVDKLVRSRVLAKKDDLAGSPAALYLCGSPGIGKTTAVKWSCQKVLKESYFIDLGIQPVFVDVNCSQLGAPGTDARKKVMGDIWEACDAGGKGCDDAKLKRMLTSKKGRKRCFVILVLDEIDNLVDPSSESTETRTSGEKLIKELYEWSSDPTCRCAVVGIGNAMNNTKYRRVEEFMKFHESMMFQSYQQDEIEAILRGKVEGHSIVDPKAISFIAKKTANVKGDARQAIEMLSTAISKAREQAEDEGNMKSQPKGPYLVGMRDVIRMNTEFTKLTALINQLTTYGKLVLVAAVRLANKSQVSESKIRLTRGDLWNTSLMVIQEKFEYVEESAIGDQIDRLHDIGVATIEGYGDSYDPITFNHMASELDAAAQETLKEAFFDF